MRTSRRSLRHIIPPSIGSGVTFVVTFVLLCTLDTLYESYHELQQLEITSQSTSILAVCQIEAPQVPQFKVIPTFMASFPGSDPLPLQMAEAFTGSFATDDKFSNGHHNAIAIQTNYPCKEGREVPMASSIKKTIIFLQHPMYDIAGYHDVIHMNSTEAPLNDWTKWRDANFSRQIKVWRKYVEYWMDAYAHSQRLIVSFEKLLSEVEGPKLAINIAEFLSRNDGVGTVPPEEIPCLWRKLVYDDIDGSDQTPQGRAFRGVRQMRKSSSSIGNLLAQADQTKTAAKQFTKAQMKEVVGVLYYLLEKYRYEKILAPIIVEYIERTIPLQIGGTRQM